MSDTALKTRTVTAPEAIRRVRMLQPVLPVLTIAAACPFVRLRGGQARLDNGRRDTG